MKLLICSLYFPPCAFTPANRVYSWAKYLNKFGIYPIIITRNWSENITEKDYFDKAVGEKVEIKKYENYEVHFVPFKGNYRTNASLKKQNVITQLFVQAFTVLEMVFRYRFTKLLPYGNLFTYINTYIKSNKIDKVLITGSPFLLFKIGYEISKKYKIPWIADYRDGWTTDNYMEQAGKLSKIVNWQNKKFEKKWVSTAESFVTVSEKIKEGIEKFIKIKGNVIYNGFYEEKKTENNSCSKNEINFLYSGVVYQNQDYKSVVEVFKVLAIEYQDKIKIKLLFLGTKFSNSAFESDKIFKNTETYIQLLDRVSYEESLKIHGNADCFIMLSHIGMKGIVSSKLFDYIKFHKPVLLFKNDNDILEKILNTSNLGLICNSKIQLEQNIRQLIEGHLLGKSINLTPNVEYINSFSREAQAKRLAVILKD